MTVSTEQKENIPTKINVSDDDLYRHSSQFRLWSFTKHEFEERQKLPHSKATERIKESLRLKGAEDRVQCITASEELQLIRFYASKVDEIAKQFHMPSQVKATAISYFRKFYLVYSVLDYHPRNILYTCAFLAAKAENYFISIETFCAHIRRTEPEHILSLEFLVLQSLSFTLAVHNGIRPLHGFFLDMQIVLKDRALVGDVGSLHDKARAIVVQGLTTDASFFFTPPQIALAALLAANESLTMEYLNLKYKENKNLMASIIKVIEDCKIELLNVSVPSSEVGKALDRKLHISLNPDKYLKRKDSNDLEGSTKRFKSGQEFTPSEEPETDGGTVSGDKD